MSFFVVFFKYFFKGRGGKEGFVVGLDNWKGNVLNKKNENMER